MKVNKSLTNPKGGTEILFDGLSSRIDLSHINFILSKCDLNLINPNKINIFWCHVSYDQEAIANLYNEYGQKFIEQCDAIVFVSHWQHDQFRKRISFPGNKCYVIPNCINVATEHNKPKNIKLIYTSMPWRGLTVLAESYSLMKYKVPLTVVSGTKIYGKEFYKNNDNIFKKLYGKLKKLGITRYDYLPNNEVCKLLEDHHILAYPSIFEETSCLSAIEALSYGLKVVTTNYGALPETCSVFADYVPLGEESEFTIRYAKALDNAVENYYYNNYQVEFYKKYYSWEARIPEWQKLIEHLCNENYIT